MIAHSHAYLERIIRRERERDEKANRFIVTQASWTESDGRRVEIKGPMVMTFVEASE